jgi:hypothetical protein
LSSNNPEHEIVFFADKIHVHHWPLNSLIWSKSTQEKIDLNLNKNAKKKKIMINDQQIRINDYEFDKIKKVGVTVPLFKKQTTLVFEGHFEDFDAHIHITTHSQNYLEIFNNLMSWKNGCFPDCF